MLLFVRHIQTLATTKFNPLTSLLPSRHRKVFNLFAAAACCASILPRMRLLFIMNVVTVKTRVLFLCTVTCMKLMKSNATTGPSAERRWRFLG